MITFEAIHSEFIDHFTIDEVSVPNQAKLTCRRCPITYRIPLYQGVPEDDKSHLEPARNHIKLHQVPTE